MNKKIEYIRIYKTTEWLIFCVAILMTLFLAGAGLYFFRSDPDTVQAFSLAFAAHTFGGRAAGIGLCIVNGLNFFWTVVYNFYLEVLIVCFTYSISILSINNYIKFRFLKYYTIRLERKARKHKEKIERYGWLGLFFFVMAPLPVTGPVIGSIIGFLLKFTIKKNFSASFLGTLAAIVIWTFFFDYLEQHLHLIRYILAAIIGIVLISYARNIKSFMTKD